MELTAPLSRPEAIAALTAPGQPFEIEPLEIAGRSVRSFKYAPPSLRAMYELYRSDLPFIIYDNDRYTFTGAWQAAARIAHVLVDCGVAPGDRVAIAMRNYPEWMLAFTAITSIGAVAVAMNAHWQPDELVHCVVDSGSRVVFA
ncbi:MAG TPA: AMP-binding protein, partial [Kofleriaceae bacterium]